MLGSPASTFPFTLWRRSTALMGSTNSFIANIAELSSLERSLDATLPCDSSRVTIASTYFLTKRTPGDGLLPLS